MSVIVKNVLMVMIITMMTDVTVLQFNLSLFKKTKKQKNKNNHEMLTNVR